MKLPCEISVWFHLPQIRADLAIELIRLGVPRKTVAMEIGVTRSAISQYIHKKRGRQLSKSESYQKEIKAAGKKIYGGASTDELRMMVCKCCHLLQEESAKRDA